MPCSMVSLFRAPWFLPRLGLAEPSSPDAAAKRVSPLRVAKPAMHPGAHAPLRPTSPSGLTSRQFRVAARVPHAQRVGKSGLQGEGWSLRDRGGVTVRLNRCSMVAEDAPERPCKHLAQVRNGYGRVRGRRASFRYGGSLDIRIVRRYI